MQWDGLAHYKVIGGALTVGFKRLGNRILLSEVKTDGTSLTNCIENVVEQTIRATEVLHGNELEFYQWCPGEGLFRLHLDKKVTRDMPPFTIRWEYMSADMKAFEVLYGSMK